MKRLLYIWITILSICSCAINADSLWSQSCEFNVGPLFNYGFIKPVTPPICNPTANQNHQPNIHHIKGYLAGIHFDFMHSRPSHWFFRLQFDGEWNVGYVVNKDPTFLTLQDYRPETNFGYSFFIHDDDTYTVTPFIGVGYYAFRADVLNFNSNCDNNGNSVTSSQGPTLHWKNPYVPIGGYFVWNIRPEHFRFGLLASYRIDTKTTIHQIMPPNNRNPDLNTCFDKNSVLKRTQGVHAEAQLMWHITQNSRVNFQAYVVPFFDWNRFNFSKCPNPDPDLAIPQIPRWYLGLHVDLGMHFSMSPEPRRMKIMQDDAGQKSTPLYIPLRSRAVQ